MPEHMDQARAARLLEMWISFYGMDDVDAWLPEDLPGVKRYLHAMELAIDVLRGNNAKTATEIKKAVKLLEEWPNDHCMDDPEDWEDEDFPFVQNALKAIQFTTSFLKESQQGL